MYKINIEKMNDEDLEYLSNILIDMMLCCGVGEIAITQPTLTNCP